MLKENAPLNRINYRPEIDGLRAIAVLGVLLYHTGIKCPGGYVGVDVFFVISGFLVTKQILNDFELSKFSLMGFWARRCRRIAPALTLVVLVTIALGAFLLLPSDYAKLGKSTAFQALFLGNLFFYNDTGYFSSESNEKPLLHTWSLAVEEQFYIALPFLLIFLSYRYGPKLLCKARLVFVVLIFLSLGWSIWALNSDTAAAFFLLPSRAWELLIGSLLATIHFKEKPCLAPLREVASVTGLCLIGFAYALYNDNTGFPGPAALAPVLGAALFIWANERVSGDGVPTYCGRIMALRPMVYIGLLSYSLYLWHWPVIAFVNYWTFDPLVKWQKVVLVLVIFAIAQLSWRFVETPFRYRWLENRRLLLGMCALTSFYMALGGTLIFVFNGLPWRMPAGISHGYSRESLRDFMFIHQTYVEDLQQDDLVNLGAMCDGQRAMALLWGDSHAMAVYPALNIALREMGVTGKAIFHSSVVPLFNFPVVVPNGPKVDTVSLNEAVWGWIRKHHPKHVILAANWHVYELKGKVVGVTPSSYLSFYQKSIVNTVKQLVEHGCQPWIMLQVPEQKYIVPKANAFCMLFGVEEAKFATKPTTWNGLAGSNNAFLDEVRAAGAKIIDPRPSFLDCNTGYYRLSWDGVVLYGDKHHLTKAGAEKVMVPFFLRELSL